MVSSSVMGGLCVRVSNRPDAEMMFRRLQRKARRIA